MQAIDLEFLGSLFDLSNIMDGESFKKIVTVGGEVGLLKHFQSDAQVLFRQYKTGLDSDANIAKLRTLYGANDPILKELTSILDMVLECFGDTMLQILLVASIVSTGIGCYKDGFSTGWTEGATIFFAVFLIVTITVGNNYIKERQFQRLQNKLEETKIQVIRNSKVEQIEGKELVVGDVMFFNLGDMFPVDGLMLSGSEVKVDESSMTGETDQIRKLSYSEILDLKDPAKVKKHSPFLISGTKVMDGTGTLLVLAVGQNTAAGKLKMLLDSDAPPTPLQQKLEGLAEDIGKVGTIVAIITFIALFCHQTVLCIMGRSVFLSIETLQFTIQAFMIAVTIIVVAVPEGLPLAVTIALAYSVNKMKEENCLVKNLASCEIMGGANTICSDKTGTLTQNLMTVTGLWIDNDIFMNQTIIEKKDHISKQMLELFAESVSYNSIAYPKKDPNTGKFIQNGNKTECALLELSDRIGFSIQFYRPTDKILKQIPFSSRRKKMTTAVFSKSTLRVHCKGAPEYLLTHCTKILSKGQEYPLDEGRKKEIKEQVIAKFAQKSLRTIAIAYKDTTYKGTQHQLKDIAYNLSEEELEKDLTLIAIAGIKDPIRKDVKESVLQCGRSGVTVRMITGDNKETAIAIAIECGILNPKEIQQYEVMEGKEFRESIGGLVAYQEDGKTALRIANQDVFSRIARKLKVMARATPEDKFMLVTGLIDLGNIVAVTGDGTNDAPALKISDVGFAMGEAGSDVSKEAADIILIDDNFSSIITAMKWGRNIYDSVRKFIQFQLTVNIVALFMAFLGAVVLNKSPLNSIQMLWVNLIMDTFASLALATEPPQLAVLDRPPYSRKQNIVSPTMYRTIFGQSVYQIIILIVVLFVYPGDQLTVFSLFFQTFVLMQVFNSILCRQLDFKSLNLFSNLFNNPLFWIIEGITVIIQYSLVYFASDYVKIRRLTLDEHLIAIGLGAGGLIIGVLFKLIPERLWRSVQLFREIEIGESHMDDSLPSHLRRKSSARLHSRQSIPSNLKVNVMNSSQKGSGSNK